MDIDFLKDRLPNITDNQIAQLETLIPLYKDWNSKINVISRKDIDNLYEHHILHSLSIAMVYSFKDKTNILDLGTGGGFPGIPLAIMFPNVYFTLIDGTGKKIKVVNAIVEQLGLKNVIAKQLRAEETKDRYDFVVTRAVAKMDKLKEWSFPLLKKNHFNAIPNGIIALKGITVMTELNTLEKDDIAELIPLQPLLELPHFDDKYLVYLQGY